MNLTITLYKGNGRGGEGGGGEGKVCMLLHTKHKTSWQLVWPNVDISHTYERSMVSLAHSNQERANAFSFTLRWRSHIWSESANIKY